MAEVRACARGLAEPRPQPRLPHSAGVSHGRVVPKGVHDVAMAAFPTASIIACTQMAGGHSSNHVVRLDVDDDAFVLKMLAANPKPEAMRAMRKEIRLATWASEHDIGPRVVAHDAARGYWVCRHIDHVYSAWQDASFEPKLSAMLRMAKRVHDMTTCLTATVPGEPWDVRETKRELARLEAHDLADERIGRAWAFLSQVAFELGDHRYHEVRCHGDINPGNALFTGGRVYLIDWEQSYLGDPMEELSAMADELGFEAQALPTLLDKYGDAAVDSLPRLERLFAMRIARRVVQAFVGMPWDAHRERQEVIATAYARFERTFLFWDASHLAAA